MIEKFLSCSTFIVVGASKDRNKFGNKVLRHYMKNNKIVVPVHPKEKTIEGISVQQLSEIALKTEDFTTVGISIITYVL